jgi:hypothetical protein
VLFVVLFMLGALAVPLAIDIGRHGRDNIFSRSGRDLLEYEFVQAFFRNLHIAANGLSAALLTISGVAISLLLFVYVGVKLTDLALNIIKSLIGLH